MYTPTKKIIYGTLKGKNLPVVYIIAAERHFCSFTYKYQREDITINYFLNEIPEMIQELKLEPILYNRISLNLYYKPSNILLKHFIMEGFKVEVYYQKPEK